ncbi:MAG: hypothetical protein ABIL89_00250 [candidate division WOR-3 bacterium]
MEGFIGIIFPLYDLMYYKIGYIVDGAYYYKKVDLKASLISLQSRGSNNYSLNLLGLGIGKKFSIFNFSIYEFLIFRKYEEFYEYGFNPAMGISLKLGSKLAFKTESYFIFSTRKILPLMTFQFGIKL